MVAARRGKTITLQRKAPEGEGSARWWLETEDDSLATSVQSVANHIEQNQRARNAEHMRFQALYNDFDLPLFGPSDLRHRAGRTRMPVIQNVIDTAGSMVAKNRPVILFTTEGANEYKLFRRARNLTRYVRGVFDDCKLYELGERFFTDACIYGTGALQVWADGDAGRIRMEHVPINELLVDDLDGATGRPSQIHRRKVTSRDKLVEEFPEHAEKIMEAGGNLPLAVQQRTTASAIWVTESWHLPSGPKAKDGLHVISIPGCVLFKEEYKKPYHQVMIYRWYPQNFSFWGRGIAQEISGIQHSINKLLWTIDVSQELVGVPVIVCPIGAMVQDDHLLNNEIGRRIDFAGDMPPQFLTPPSVNPELYQHLQYLEQRAYQIVGVNQGMAQGSKPAAGLPSALAQREVSDLASGRLQCIGQRYEAFFVDIARVVVDLSRDLYRDHKDLSVKARGKFLSTIKWSDVNIDDDRFEIETFPVSMLPFSPAGRLQMITEWDQRGWIPKEIVMDLMGIPDLTRFIGLETGSIDLVEMTIDKIKDTGEYDSVEDGPVAEQNLDLAFGLITRHIPLAKSQGLDDDTINELRRYAADVRLLLDQAAPPPAPPGPPPGMMPPGAPGMPPGPPAGPPGPMPMAA